MISCGWLATPISLLSRYFTPFFLPPIFRCLFPPLLLAFPPLGVCLPFGYLITNQKCCKCRCPCARRSPTELQRLLPHFRSIISFRFFAASKSAPSPYPYLSISGLTVSGQATIISVLMFALFSFSIVDPSAIRYTRRNREIGMRNIE